jgi:hypothetical protein
VFDFGLTNEQVFAIVNTVTRTRVRWGRMGVAVACACLAVSFLAGRAGAGAARSDRPERRTYVVRTGDTLWGIASSLVGPEGDPRPFVDRLGRTNHVASGVIEAGDVLVLPDP